MGIIADIEDVIIRVMEKRQKRHPEKYFGLTIRTLAKQGAEAIASMPPMSENRILEACEQFVIKIEQNNTKMPSSLSGGGEGGHA